MDLLALHEEFCEYSTFIRGYTKETIRRYRQTLKVFMKITGIVDTRDISEDTVKKFFMDGRVERGWAASTYVTYHKSFVVFLRWLVQKGYLEANPAEDMELPRIEKKIPLKLTKQEAERLLEVVYNYPYKYRFLKYRNHAVFATFLFAGLRKGELVNLKYGDVDLENQSLFVRQGKGRKDRIIPICSRLKFSLEKYMTERARLGKKCPEFFTSLNRDRGLTQHGLKHLVKWAKEATGIQFGLHKLRHTFATLMLEGGCDIYSLSRMMGHSDIKTTTIYLAASAEHLRSQIYKHPMNI